MPHTPIRLIAGLGNPGRQHERDRHNVGFWLVSRLADQHRVTLVKDALASSTHVAHDDALQRMTDGGLIKARTVDELCKQISADHLAAAQKH